jgi:hypothetical protein
MQRRDQSHEISSAAPSDFISGKSNQHTLPLGCHRKPPLLSGRRTRTSFAKPSDSARLVDSRGLRIEPEQRRACLEYPVRDFIRVTRDFIGRELPKFEFLTGRFAIGYSAGVGSQTQLIRSLLLLL